MRATPRIMVGQSRVRIGGEADIELGLLVPVSQNVDETLVSSHDPTEAIHMPWQVVKYGYIRRLSRRRWQFPLESEAEAWLFLRACERNLGAALPSGEC
jgi:hypothetical protein